MFKKKIKKRSTKKLKQLEDCLQNQQTIIRQQDNILKQQQEIKKQQDEWKKMNSVDLENEIMKKVNQSLEKHWSQVKIEILRDLENVKATVSADVKAKIMENMRKLSSAFSET